MLTVQCSLDRVVGLNRSLRSVSQIGATQLLLFDGFLLPYVCACVVHLSWSVRRYVMDTLLYLITEETYRCYEEAVAESATRRQQRTNSAASTTGPSATSSSPAPGALPDDVPSPHLLLVRAWEKSAVVLDEYTPYSDLVLVLTNKRGICNEEKLLQRDDYQSFLVSTTHPHISYFHIVHVQYSICVVFRTTSKSTLNPFRRLL